MDQVRRLVHSIAEDEPAHGRRPGRRGDRQCNRPQKYKGGTPMYTAIRFAFVLAAAVFSSSAFGDYVANRLDYVDPGNGAVANYTQLLSINNKGTAVGAASFDGSVTTFGFIYDPATGDYVRLPQPLGFDGITSFANPTGINDAGVITG